MMHDMQGPITGRDLALLLYPSRMPFSAPKRAGQILARLARDGWLERGEVEGRYPGAQTYVLSAEGRKVLETLDEGP